MVDGDPDADDAEDSIELRRRDALSLPLTEMFGYGVLSESVGHASAAGGPEQPIGTTSIVDPSETTMHSLPVPPSADSILADIHAKIAASTAAGTARTEFYIGDELVADVSCSGTDTAEGCAEETTVDTQIDISRYSGEDIDIWYKTSRRGFVELQDSITILVDGEASEVSEFPLPELEGPCSLVAGETGTFRIPSNALHDSVNSIEWTVTNLDTGAVVDETGTIPRDTDFTFDEPGEYFVEAEPYPDDTDEIGKAIVTVISEPEPIGAPTAVEMDEGHEVTFEFEVPSSRIAPSSFDFNADQTISYRDEWSFSNPKLGEVTDDGGFESGHPGCDDSIPDDPQATPGYTATATVGADPASEISPPADYDVHAGIGFETKDFLLTHRGNTLFDQQKDPATNEYVPGISRFRTFAFQEVDEIGLVAAHPDGVQRNSSASNSPKTGTDLASDIRRKTEFLNEYYASGLGSMGAKGFNVHNLNQTNLSETKNGWLKLSSGPSSYGGRRAVDFVDDALNGVNEDFGVPISNIYDTALVMSPEKIGKHAFYAGNMLAEGDADQFLQLDFDGAGILEMSVSILNGQINDALPIRPFSTEHGEIDAVYHPLTGSDALRHEFGHACGDEHMIGLPDMYYADYKTQLTMGTIQGWGLMGTGDSMCSFSRWLGGEFWDIGTSWLDAEASIHKLETSVSPSALTDKNLQDPMQVVFSPYAEFDVDLIDLTPGIGDIDPKCAIYIVERREKGSRIENPFSGDLLDLGADGQGYNGVALYRFGILEFGAKDILGEFIESNTSYEVNNSEIIDHDYISQNGEVHSGETPPNPTLSTGNSGPNSWYDPDTHARFSASTSGGSTSVDINRDVTDLITIDVPGASITKSILADATEFFTNLPGELGAGAPPEDIPPLLDVLAETADGQQVGTDPDTGNTVNEIDGARIISIGQTRGVFVPGERDIDVTVSADRLRAHLEEQGINVPDEVEYERTVIVDNDTTIEDRDGIPYLSGRTKQRSKATTAGSDSALASVDARIQPPKVNTNSRGKFVTAHLGIPDGADASDLRVESVFAEQVQAVTDEQYGFVRNIQNNRRGGTESAMVKFPRDELIDSLGTGTHRVSITAVFGETTATATTDLEVFEPGGPNNNQGRGQGGRHGGSQGR